MTIKKILCVDDSRAELAFISMIISNAGFAVISANNGQEAIQKAQAEIPDLIFLDIVMLGMDGFAVMRELQKRQETKNISVVFVSSKSQKADQEWAKMQGASGFVPKPVTEQNILNEINRLKMKNAL